MINELKEKLNNLSDKLKNELDIISLKALCNMPESEEILFAINGTLNRLIEKYPDDEEILWLLPKKEKISLEELIKVLEEKYSNNVEVITIKALIALPEGELRERAINQSLERLLEENSNDEDIMEYLEIEEVESKEQNPNMIFVEGGSYIPSFFDEERTTFDLYVSKYDTTNDEWDELMEINPSKILGARKPVNNVSRIQVFEFCNKMSEKYGLQPVYKIENDKLEKIIYKGGKEEYPNLADFRKTEGYRLPTEIEWEWFSWGGKLAQEQEIFYKEKAEEKRKKREKESLENYYRELNKKNGYSDELFSWQNSMVDFGLGQILSFQGQYYIDYAWYGKTEVHDVGLKKPNELGLFDMIGNVNQHVYDTMTKGHIDDKKLYIYDENDGGCLRGGDCDVEGDKFIDLYFYRTSNKEKTGFRVVRTANPKR